MINEGLLVVLSGPSGCGKGTILKELLQSYENTFLSISATTRLPREGEQDGVNYHFLQTKKFEALIDEGGMLEHANYCGNYYGTPKKDVLDRLAKGQDVILEIEVQGAMQIKKAYPKASFVFIMPPDLKELRRRLTDRNTEDEKTIDRRMATAALEIEIAYEYDYVVINNEVAQATTDLVAVIAAEKCSKKRMKNFIDEVLKNA